MQFQVEFTEKALNDADSIVTWFRSQDAKEAGDRWYVELFSKIDTLEQNPRRCPMVAEFSESDYEIRELLVGKRRGKYRVFSRIIDNLVLVLRIRHGARQQIEFKDLS